jgi:hypothetical protein
MTTLHVSKFIFVKHEELVAVLAFKDCHVGHHILEVPLRVTRTEMSHINDQHLLESHVLHNVIVHRNRPVLFRRVLLVDKLQHALCKQIILKTIISIEVHRLFCAFIIFIPLVITNPSTISWLLTVVCRWHVQRWVHLENLEHFVRRNVCIRDEFHKR